MRHAARLPRIQGTSAVDLDKGEQRVDDKEDGAAPDVATTAGATPVAPDGGVAAQLRAERERQGLSLDEMGERTKIAKRHLLTIEEGRFADLPGRTYAIGFVRSYARSLGIDEASVVDRVRDQLGAGAPPAPARNLDYLEPGDPARIPSAALAWGVAALLVVVLVAGFFLWRGYFIPASGLPPVTADRPVAAAPAAPAAAASAAVPSGAVTVTAATDGVWVKIYERGGAQLFQKEMALNESFTVPEAARAPLIWTGRPEALKIAIGGRAVAPLAAEQRTIKDVPIDAASLNARTATPAAPAPAAPPAPAAR